MAGSKHKKLTGKLLWGKTLTAERNLDIILGSVCNLAIKYWRDSFFLTGTLDRSLLKMTGGRFPCTTRPGKTHPVFTLKALPDHSGYRVCPCSSRKPFDKKPYRYIKKGCRLNFTRHEMDKNSYLVENIVFNIPPSVAVKLYFKGQVPDECVVLKKDDIKMPAKYSAPESGSKNQRL